MRSPFSPLHLLVFAFLIAFILAVIQIGVMTIAFDKLGISPDAALLLLFCSLAGSVINLPLFQINAEHRNNAPPPALFRGLLRQLNREFHGKTTIAINVGGCLIPLTFSLYLIHHHTLTLAQLGFATLIVSVVCYFFSRPISGVGIGMPIFIAPITAALIAILIGGEQSAPLAYICGTLGVIIGADILRIKDIREMGVPIASIGGAGTFDGIFLTGIVAVLLA